MKKLTIKELAPYLPYGLKARNGADTFEIIAMNKGTVFFKGGLLVIEEIKPLLRPLSSINLKWFQDNIDEAIEDFRINCEPENNHFSVEVCEKVLGWSALSLEEYQLFYRDHVDIHGLIDLDLALPIDGKEVEGE